MDLAIISINLALFSATAYAILAKKWYRSLPLLSTYVFVLAISTLLALITDAGQKFQGSHQCDFCRAYSVTYLAYLMLISIFSIIVLFEFLFRMAGGKKSIQITAVTGCLLTAGLSLAGALEWGHTPEHFVTIFWRVTTLTLLLAGGAIWIMKAVFFLVIQKRLAILLTVIAIYPFAQVMSDYLNSNAGQFFAQLLWPIFALVLCVVLMKGPAAQQPPLLGLNRS